MDADNILIRLIQEGIVACHNMVECIVEDLVDAMDEETTVVSVPRPMHTSHYTGHVWVHDILRGHEK